MSENKVISCSLWVTGDWSYDHKYVQGLVNNINLLGVVYPDWKLRIYHDQESVQFFDNIKADPWCDMFVELIDASYLEIEYGMYWRYCVSDDPNVDRFIVRDLDDRLNWSDKAAVEEWMESGYPFHLMRGNNVHNFKVMGGLWGATKGALPFSMMETVREYEKNVGCRDKWEDQRFLGEYLYPHARGNCLVHGYDMNFNSGEVRDFPITPYVGGAYDGSVPTWEDANEWRFKAKD